MAETKELTIPVYYFEDEETGEKHYDFEEMANVLENTIYLLLNRKTLITISELEDDKEEE